MNVDAGILARSERIAPVMKGITRIAVGFMFWSHGAQKLLGWFGGQGFAATASGFEQGMGIPVWLTVLVVVAEFFGAFGLLLGLLGRLAAFGVGCVLAVAALMVHLPNGFFMNWSGQQAGEGFEYHILGVALALVVMIGGSGRWSVDRAIAGSGERAAGFTR